MTKVQGVDIGGEPVRYAYLLTLGRLPSPSERKLVMDYLTHEEKLPLLCQALLCTVEFSSIDQQCKQQQSDREAV